MKIATGYASLPACFASIKDRLIKTGTLEAMRTQAFPGETVDIGTPSFVADAINLADQVAALERVERGDGTPGDSAPIRRPKY